MIRTVGGGGEYSCPRCLARGAAVKRADEAPTSPLLKHLLHERTRLERLTRSAVERGVKTWLWGAQGRLALAINTEREQLKPKLEPCPFCGRAARAIEGLGIGCSWADCPSRQEHTTMTDAVKAWNTRTT